MSIWGKAKYFVSASFLSLILGLLGLYYTLRASKTSLVADVVAESNVMDVRTPLKDLTVLFQGQDIQKENSNLKVLTVRLLNEGESNILESYFDSRIPWGLQIGGGRLIEARITGSNSRYLSENLRPRITGPSEVTFDKIIFDKGKYVEMELLVLHNKNGEPRVAITGKIAGMDEIPVRNSFRERDQEGFARRVFKGPLAVQIARTIAYFFMGLFAITIVGLSVAGISSISSKIKERSRARMVRGLPRAATAEHQRKRQVLLETYIKGGLEGLRRTRAMLKDQRLLETVLLKSAPGRGEAHPHPNHPPISQLDGPVIIDVRPSLALSGLLRENLLRVENNSIVIDPEIPELLNTLIAEIKQLDEGDTDSSADGTDSGANLKGDVG